MCYRINTRGLINVIILSIFFNPAAGIITSKAVTPAKYKSKVSLTYCIRQNLFLIFFGSYDIQRTG